MSGAAKPKKEPHPKAFHPLFPIAADAQDVDLSQRDISHIYVFRGVEQLGRFEASQLGDETAIADHFGGGKFTLRARDQSMGHWTANAELHLPGPPRQPEQAQPSPQRAIPGDNGASFNWMQLLALGLPALMEFFKAQSQQRLAEMTMMLQMARPNAPDNSVIKELLPLLMAKAQAPATNEVLQVLKTGIELGASSVPQADPDDVSDTIGQIVNGMQAAAEMQKASNDAASIAAQKEKPG